MIDVTRLSIYLFAYFWHRKDCTGNRGHVISGFLSPDSTRFISPVQLSGRYRRQRGRGCVRANHEEAKRLENERDRHIMQAPVTVFRHRLLCLLIRVHAHSVVSFLKMLNCNNNSEKHIFPLHFTKHIALTIAWTQKRVC